MTEPVNDALSLWRIFSRKGGLSPKTHDASLLAELRDAMQVPAGEDIAAFLDRTKPTTTKFLMVVLNAMAPMGAMLSDIYAMFGRHGVTSSDEQVLVEFDFGAAHNKLQFNAAGFRASIEGLREVARSQGGWAFTAPDLFEVKGRIFDLLAKRNPQTAEDGFSNATGPVIGRSGSGKAVFQSDEPKNAGFAQWRWGGLATESNWDYWPYGTQPPIPSWDAGDPLGSAVAPLVFAILELGSLSSRYSSWATLQAMQPGPDNEPGYRTKAQPRLWALQSVRSAQVDRLAPNMLALLWHLKEIAPTSALARKALASEIEKNIRDHSNVISASAPAKVLSDLLNLPFWKFRHQIYAIWLVTVIEDAVAAKHPFELASDTGKLTFSFTKTVIADIRVGGLNLQLVSELRTPAGDARLLGKGRKANVQPDYVLQQADGVNKGQVIYVLEAKQYANSSLRNFSHALHDYAAVYRDALVSLVNYGPVTESVAVEVQRLCSAPNLQRMAQRCTTFAEVRPASTTAVDALKAHVLQAADALAQCRPLLLIDVSASMADVLPARTSVRMRGIWTALENTHLPVCLVAEGFQLNYPEDSACLEHGGAREHLQNAALALGELDDARRKGAVLLTDAGGFAETAEYHADLAAVIVLDRLYYTVIHSNPRYREDIAWALASIFSCEQVRELDLFHE